MVDDIYIDCLQRGDERLRRFHILRRRAGVAAGMVVRQNNILGVVFERLADNQAGIGLRLVHGSADHGAAVVYAALGVQADDGKFLIFFPNE